MQGAAYLGFALQSRTTEQLAVATPSGGRNTYDVLATLEFSSDRKRMSIVVRSPAGKLLLITKGADSVILARLAPGAPGVEQVKGHLVRQSRRGR